MGSSDSSDPDFKVYSTTYESLSGKFNASETDPFANMVNGSSHSYIIEQILDKITSETMLLLKNMCTAKATHYISYLSSYR